MPATYQDVLRIALALPGVSEGRSYGTPSLHVGRKFIARLRDEDAALVIKVDVARRAKLLRDAPDTFFLEDHYRDHPYVLVHLPAVAADELRRVVEGAWRMVASKRQITAHDGAALAGK